MARKSVESPVGAVLCALGAMLFAPIVFLASQRPAEAAEAARCASSDTPRVNVVVEGVRSDRGELVVELYPDDPKRFLAHAGRVQRVRQKAESDVTNACINAPGAGMFALVLYHDENNDAVFNRGRLGLPSEGFGFSNNVKPRFGAPSLKSVLFAVPEGESTVRVRIRYLKD